MPRINWHVVVWWVMFYMVWMYGPRVWKDWYDSHLCAPSVIVECL